MTELKRDDLTADKIHAYTEQEEQQKKTAQGTAAEHAREQREQLRKKFEAEQVPADALQHVFGMVRKAVEQGEKDVMVLHFPSEFLPDKGRSINIESRVARATRWLRRAGLQVLRKRTEAPWLQAERGHHRFSGGQARRCWFLLELVIGIGRDQHACLPASRKLVATR